MTRLDCAIPRLGFFALLLLAVAHAYAATPTPEMQKAARAGTFEVVLKKPLTDPLSYEKPLPLDLIPYQVRNDPYWSIGTAFAIAPDTYVSAGHVLEAAIGAAPALRDSAGHVYPVKQILKFSQDEDFVVFTIADAPAAVPLPTRADHTLDDVVFAVGNALGEGVVIRDGLLTSETPEAQDGRWKWLRFSAAASPGNSGGPLLDAAGHVIGIVNAKSPNENLNYALPIGLVLAAPGNATFDLRYSTKLPNARYTGVATLRTQFPLPKSFADFSQTYQSVIQHASQRDQQQLQRDFADRLFPKGNAAKLLATVYDSSLLTFVQQDSSDTWDDVNADNIADQDLPGGGLVTTGTSLGVTVFRLRRPDGASDGQFYRDPKALMDFVLQGLKFTRPVGDQAIRITSLGVPQQQSIFEDGYGRRWQVSAWPLSYIDSYVVCFALPVPEGYEGMVQIVGSPFLDRMNDYMRSLANFAYVNYSGTLAQWQAFLGRTSLRPRVFDHIQLDISASQDIRYQSPRLQLQLPKDLIGTSASSDLVLSLGYMLDGARLTWDVGGIYLYKNEQRQTGVGLMRHVKPAADAQPDVLDTWSRMASRGAGFAGVAGHDDAFKSYWIHESLSAPSEKTPGIDPGATVLYDVYYLTDAKAYPRDLEDSERQLLLATHVLER